ncbi:MAG TPA: hypothetical protein EYP22_09350 [Methanosarcinales archaeon]|nr:hypothetical protein [Methanosarcinales archaeon]
MITLINITLLLGIILFSIAVFHAYKKHNFDFPTVIELTIFSFITASSIVMIGISSIYYAIFGVYYPGQSAQDLRLPILIGGLTVSIATFYYYIVFLKKISR